MKSLSRKASKLLILTAVLIFSAYLFFISPSLLNLDRNAEADSLNITNVVMQYVKRYYVDKSAIEPKAMLVEGLNRLEQIVDEVLVDFPQGEDGGTFVVQVEGEKATFDMSGVNDLDLVTARLEQVFEFITPHLKGNDPKVSDIEYAVLDQMLTSLDQHSGIITPQIYKEFMIETEGSFGGLGIVIGVRDGNLTVISPIEGTPAYRIGIKPNDRIVQIENESTINMSLIEAVGKLRGQKGTEVSIHVMREGLSEPKEYKIVRDTIVIESVETFDLEDGIKYVRIRDFQKNTLDSILHSLNTSPEMPSGIILDLRGNPGGLLDQAQRISDLFLTDGVIVTTQIGSSSKPYHANNKDEEFTGKVVVLVDAGSASASEIVAGALKNNERAIVIGERTFGKGSVQQIFDLNDGSALKLTIAQYLTPGDKSIQDVGVTPDIMLHPTIFTGESSVFHPDSDNRLNQPQKKNARKKHEVFEKPIYNISYLDEKEVPSEDDAEPIPEEALTKDERRKALDEDFYVSLAKDIIENSKEQSREESLGEIKPDIDKISKSEEFKIEDKWQALGIDWSNGNGKIEKPSISTVVTPARPEIKAGDKLELKVEVENKGQEPVYRLMATTRSENPVFEGKELIFGKLEPGEKRSWTTTFEVPKWTLTRDDIVSLEFLDAAKSPIPDYKFDARTMGLERPLYSYNYEIVDDGRLGSRGNGNGVPEAGEEIVLLVRVKNIGQGTSEKTVLTLKNNSGDKIFLEKGRVEIENLPPGDVRDAAFTFAVNSTEPTIDLELQIVDDVFKEGLISKSKIPGVGDGEGYVQKELFVTVPGEGAPIRGGSFKDAPIVATAEKGATFSAIGQNSNWVKIKLDNDFIGWANKDKVIVSESQSKTSGQGAPQFRKTFEAPPIMSFTPPPATTSASTITLDGKVTSSDGIELVSVFIGDNKVALIPSAKKELPVSVEINLDEDVNLITVIAKDTKGLLSKQSFVVRKEAQQG